MEEIRIKQLTVGEHENWFNFYINFLSSSHLRQVFKICIFTLVLVFICFVFGRISEIQSESYSFIYEYLKFLSICLVVLGFVLLGFLPLIFFYYSKNEIVFSSYEILKKRKSKVISKVAYIDLTKVVVVDGLLIDIWFKTGSGVRDSFRLLGEDRKQNEKIISLLKEKNMNLAIQYGFWR